MSNTLETNREKADRILRELAEKLRAGAGNPLVISRKIDDWLDYRAARKRDGTLDETTVL